MPWATRREGLALKQRQKSIRTIITGRISRGQGKGEEREREADRQTDRGRHIERQRERDRDERETDSQADRQIDTHKNSKSGRLGGGGAERRGR